MITIWTIVFGRYHKFFNEWYQYAAGENPDSIVVVSDKKLNVDAKVIVADPIGPHTEYKFRNIACDNADDGWLWQIDVDDRIIPGAINILENQSCDILQVGYIASDGEVYIPKEISNEDFLAINNENVFSSGSPFTKDIWSRAGGIPVVGYGDWAFWRACARIGAKIEFSGFPAYFYRREFHDSLTGLKKRNADKHIKEAIKF